MIKMLIGRTGLALLANVLRSRVPHLAVRRANAEVMTELGRGGVVGVAVAVGGGGEGGGYLAGPLDR